MCKHFVTCAFYIIGVQHWVSGWVERENKMRDTVLTCIRVGYNEFWMFACKCLLSFSCLDPFILSTFLFMDGWESVGLGLQFSCHNSWCKLNLWTGFNFFFPAFPFCPVLKACFVVLGFGFYINHEIFYGFIPYFAESKWHAGGVIDADPNLRKRLKVFQTF